MLTTGWRQAISKFGAVAVYFTLQVGERSGAGGRQSASDAALRRAWIGRRVTSKPLGQRSTCDIRRWLGSESQGTRQLA